MKALRIALYLTATAVALVLALAGALWIWSGTATSLSVSLAQLARWLPAGQTLEAKDVTGSLRSGGSMGWLRWQKGGLSVEVRDVAIAWSLRPLLGGELRLGLVTAKHLRIEDHRPSDPEERAPPTDLRLPLAVDIPFAIDSAEWVGATTVQATGLAGHYVFDSYSHTLFGGQAHISSGAYRVEGSLQAVAPMALAVQAEGAVQTTLPSSPTRLQVRAHATLRGALAGQDATLALQAELLPELVPGRQGAPGKGRAMQASISAQLQPWHAQPVAQAKAQWQALDLATLWPQAPQTQLSGEATVSPQGAGWQAGIELGNALSGPWDQQRLPLDKLDARVAYSNGQWNIQSLHATGAGGRVEAQGRVNTAVSGWQAHAMLYGIHPAALDSRLGDTVLNGQITAQQGPGGIAFEAQLKAVKERRKESSKGGQIRPSAKNLLDGLRIQSVQAQGLWSAPLLKLNTLSVQTDDARLQGQLTFNTLSRATQSKLSLGLPGAQATLAGELASTHGQGEWDLRIADAALASRWFKRLPGAPAPPGQASLQGNATFTGHWQGGWQNQGQALRLQSQLRAPRLDILANGPALTSAWLVRDGQIDLAGTLRDLTLSTRGQLATGTRQINLQAQAQGGRLREGEWRVQLNTAVLTAQDTQKPGTWSLKLNDRVTFHWKEGANTRALEASAGTAYLSGPIPGSSQLSWQAARWAQNTIEGKVRTQWRTQGRVADLPLAWLDLLGKSQMANLGLRGDLVFAGQWDASSSETLKLRALLERTSGDLELQTDSGPTGSLQAGVRDARLLVSTDGSQLSASLHWDSERAGQAQAQFSTRLQRQDGSWTWPMKAALAGKVKVQLPPVGIWSLLAPPGWRLRGTVDADAVLSGTRGAPQWRGTLAAQDLAVRSVVDGIDFSHGTLRATLNGQRLEIQEFSLQGAGGQSGGRLSINGFVLWQPQPPSAPNGTDQTTLVQGLRMELQATAQALRLSARADRRLVVSGTLSAQLSDARLALRGLLKADRALWVLPDDTAPRLGDDVVVRMSGAEVARTQAGTTPAPTLGGVDFITDIAITLDLGPDFQVRGRGISTRLAGTLNLSQFGRDLSPRVKGTLNTEQGRYQAYGQNLEIERGLLRFVGPYDNPALDVLAIRPNLPQRVGVQITGTAQSPVVRLYAEPSLPEAEILAWLVLGRSGANDGAETAVLQQAALSLLGGKGKGLSGGLAQTLGLDELAVRGDGANNIDGTTSATVLVGKRLSRDFYLTYERGLSGTLGTLSIFYDLSRRFALRAQRGEQSAIDLIYTLLFD
jgi:translocation and assembly module TamB